MLGNILGWLAIVVVAILLGWLTWRAWRIKNAILKWVAVVLSGLLTLVLVLVVGVIGRGLYILYAPRNAPVPALAVAGTPEQIARGEHIWTTKNWLRCTLICGVCLRPND
jgi:hypothetical protein